MKETSLYLEPEIDRRLDRLAKAQGISKAEVIRRTLAEAVRRAERPRITAIGVGFRTGRRGGRRRPPPPGGRLRTFVIVVDTSVIYALLDRRDRRHREAVVWYRAVDDEFATTPLVLAETDHLASTRAGPEAARAFRHDVRSGAYLVGWGRAPPLRASRSPSATQTSGSLWQTPRSWSLPTDSGPIGLRPSTSDTSARSVPCRAPAGSRSCRPARSQVLAPAWPGP